MGETMKIDNGRLYIAADDVQTLRDAERICNELRQLEGAGLLAVTAGQASLHLSDLRQAFEHGVAVVRSEVPGL